MGLRRRNIRLRTFFIRYLLVLFAGFAMTVFVGIGLFSIALRSGVVLSVSEVEAQIEAQITNISSAKKVNAKIIPKTCRYAVVNFSGEFLYGNMSEAESDRAFHAIQSGTRLSREASITDWNVSCYSPIERQQDLCIVEYSALSQFSSEFLRKYLPSPEIALFWTIFVSFLIEIFLLSKFYGKKISRKLIPLQYATEKIQNKDLEFQIQYSGIQEIDTTLQSLDSMKTELKQSLEKQWNMEQMRKTQISALAHDLKTPLTVVRGNAEMLFDTEQTQEQKEYTQYILKNADQMEQYVQMLIDLSKMGENYPVKMERVDTRSFLNEIYMQVRALAATKQIRVEIKENSLPSAMYLDASLILRALMNIAANAVEHSPKHSKVQLSASAQDRMFQITLTDSGTGFSPQDLKHAKKQFYQGDASRNSKFHFGMGLFIADSIAKLHSGTLMVANSSVTESAMVTLKIQIAPKPETDSL